jgi:hypothetical protein
MKCSAFNCYFNNAFFHVVFVAVQAAVITACGDVVVAKPFYISDNPYDIWGWIKASAVPLTMSFTILTIFQYFIRKLDQFC